jgi:hypothetical protein
MRQADSAQNSRGVSWFPVILTFRGVYTPNLGRESAVPVPFGDAILGYQKTPAASLPVSLVGRKGTDSAWPRIRAKVTPTVGRCGPALLEDFQRDALSQLHARSTQDGADGLGRAPLAADHFPEVAGALKIRLTMSFTLAVPSTETC